MRRPSDGFTFDELREEFDWMYEFQSRMAERITGDPDVHSLVDYVRKLKDESDELRVQLAIREESEQEAFIDYLRGEIRDWEAKYREMTRECKLLEAENAKLREMCRRLFDELYTLVDDNCSDVYTQYERSDVQPFYDELRELGVEVDA